MKREPGTGNRECSIAASVAAKRHSVSALLAIRFIGVPASQPTKRPYSPFTISHSRTLKECNP